MPDSNARPETIAELLRSRNSFLILSHMRPDGDAIGCQLAMAHCLKALGKTVKVWNEDGMPEKFAFLPGAEWVTTPPATHEGFDVVLALDTATFKRLGVATDRLRGTPVWVNMDHHITNERYGDLRYVDPDAPATGQILYDFITRTGLPFNYAVADCLYVAISTDTGSFQYPQTTARTYEIAAELVKAGVNVGEINRLTYDSYPLRRVKLLREVLNNLEMHSENRLAAFTLTQETFQRTGALPEDTEGLIDHIRAIDSVVVAMLIEEVEDGQVRLSMRSKDARVSVASLAAHFNGGGHTLAAGARTRGTVAEVRSEALALVGQAIERVFPSEPATA
jgi:phosphoesterase RecJ-like protein